MAGGVKACTWIMRLFQLFFAIILVGIISYMINQFHRYRLHVPRELIVPEVFSVLAIVVTGFSILSVFFLSYILQLVAALFDLAMFAGYLASAILLRHNYRIWISPLRAVLSDLGGTWGLPHHVSRNTGLVRLLIGLTVIQTVLFLNTTILSIFVAKDMEKKKRGLEEKKRGHATA
ncbi:hypothetical protein HOY80DRAFT_413566 [Tuber brumale]|nr:hypothetical protein HOY80DRAFT_413566 [Tuber brumale]